MSRRSAPHNALDVYRIPYDGPDDLPTKDMVGSKAHNLMRMGRRSLSVPPGVFAALTSTTAPPLSTGSKTSSNANSKPLVPARDTSSAIRSGRCWCQCAPVPRSPCLA